MQYQRLGDWLFHKGLITSSQLNQAIAMQAIRAMRLGQVLVEMGFVTEEQITACLAEQYELSVSDLSRLRCQKEALALMPPTLALARRVLPHKIKGEALHCIIADPLDIPATDEVARSAEKRIVLSLAAPTPLWNAIIRAYKLPKSAIQTSEPAPAPKREPKLADDRDRRELLFRLRSANSETSLWEKFAGGAQ